MTRSMRCAFGCFSPLIICATLAFGVDTPSSLTAAPAGTGSPSGAAFATFHSMSLYYNPDSTLQPPQGNKIWVHYRKSSDAASAWSDAYPMWWDTRTVYLHQGRGSIDNLQPNTKYVIEVGVGPDTGPITWLHYL